MIIANFKSNVINFDKWVDDFENSCVPVDFYVGIAPPSIYITEYSSFRLAIGAQDVDHSSGSRTGAVSIEMLDEVGVEFVIIGHSERREFFHEDNDLIRKKIQAVNESKIGSIILCIGETKEENKMGATKDVLKNQLSVIDGFELGKNFTIAYEPVWAIGSGHTPEPKDINEIHKYIKDVVQSVSENNHVPDVVYGGSVTDKNAESFFKEEFVDGALVGGASLNGSTFANIVNKWRENII
jgi:triosephosphate isomerase